MVEQNRQPGALLRLRGEPVQVVERDLGFEQMPAAKGEGVELGAGQMLGRRLGRGCGEVR